ncbi:MAG: hypothetical protein GXP47_06830, partial [Acidobacteria bacterium]|nr:hypothetical protein [Acidobacteriota bacterium]
MPAEEAPGRKVFEEALETLRRRGYLGRSGAGPPLRAVRAAWGMVAAGLAVAVAGLALAAVLPTRPAAVSATGLLLAPVYLGALLLCWLLVLLAEAVHRRGLGVGASAAGAAAVGGSGAFGWVFLAGRPWAPPYGLAILAGFGLAVAGTALLMRGLARAVVLRILRRPAGGPGVVPRLWRVTVLTLGAVAILLGAAMLQGRGAARGAGRGESLHVRPGTRRLAVIGVDGAARAEVELLADRYPALEALRGWRWATLKEDVPEASLPVRWITVATGMPPGRRGVATFRQVAVGSQGPVLLLPPLLRRIVVALWSPLGVVEEQTVPAAHRGVPTVWEMASQVSPSGFSGGGGAFRHAGSAGSWPRNGGFSLVFWGRRRCSRTVPRLAWERFPARRRWTWTGGPSAPSGTRPWPIPRWSWCTFPAGGSNGAGRGTVGSQRHPCWLPGRSSPTSACSAR